MMQQLFYFQPQNKSLALRKSSNRDIKNKKNNCLKNGILTIELSEEKFLKLKDIFIDEINFNLLTVDLINQTLVDQTGNEISKFDIDINSKLMLTQGLDEIDLTLKELNKIKNWESKLEPISLLLQKSIAQFL